MIATAIHVAAAAGLGGMAGLLGGLFGVGGGFLVIPLLGFFYGMNQQTAQGTLSDEEAPFSKGNCATSSITDMAQSAPGLSTRGSHAGWAK